MLLRVGKPDGLRAAAQESEECNRK